MDIWTGQSWPRTLRYCKVCQKETTHEIRAGAKVIATGNLAGLIEAETSVIDHLEPHLSLIGLRLMWELNQEHAPASGVVATSAR